MTKQIEIKDNYTNELLAVVKTIEEFKKLFAAAEITAEENTADKHIIYVY